MTWLLLATRLAQADPVPEPTPGPAPNQAEYVRLQQELEKLVERNAWAGAERTYGEMVATGFPPTFADHMAGAYAARAMGNVKGTRERLIAANAMQEDKGVLDWLWDLDANYGRVFLACNSGSGGLEAAALPFDPVQRRAVEYAQARIQEDGLFDGFLPQGDYAFAGSTVHVVPRVQAVRIDLRTQETARKAKKTKEDGAASSGP